MSSVKAEEVGHIIKSSAFSMHMGSTANAIFISMLLIIAFI
jgi:hypothetical protein